MAYCGPRGIPYMHFIGGPDEWDPISQDLALEWSARERAKCPGCGTHPADWDDKRGGHFQAFLATGERCRGCESLAGFEVPKEEKGVHKILIPNLDLPMWSHLRR